MKLRCPSCRPHIYRLALLALLAAGVASWIAALPNAWARDPTPAEMIAEGLPAKRTLKNASQSDFLGAVCSAVKKHRETAAGITSMAVVARRELAGDIVGMVLRCDGQLTCDFMGPIVAAAIAADGNPALVVDAAMAKAPTCAEMIREAVKRGTGNSRRTAADIISSDDLIPRMDDEFDPREDFKLVCDGKTSRVVRASQLNEFLRSHPGSYLGNCPPPALPPPAPVAKAVAPASTAPTVPVVPGVSAPRPTQP